MCIRQCFTLFSQQHTMCKLWNIIYSLFTGLSPGHPRCLTPSFSLDGRGRPDTIIQTTLHSVSSPATDLSRKSNMTWRNDGVPAEREEVNGTGWTEDVVWVVGPLGDLTFVLISMNLCITKRIWLDKPFGGEGNNLWVRCALETATQPALSVSLIWQHEKPSFKYNCYIIHGTMGQLGLVFSFSPYISVYVIVVDDVDVVSCRKILLQQVKRCNNIMPGKGTRRNENTGQWFVRTDSCSEGEDFCLGVGRTRIHNHGSISFFFFSPMNHSPLREMSLMPPNKLSICRITTRAHGKNNDNNQTKQIPDKLWMHHLKVIRPCVTLQEEDLSVWFMTCWVWGTLPELLKYTGAGWV